MYIWGLPCHCCCAGKKTYKIWEDVQCETHKNGNVTETPGASGAKCPFGLRSWFIQWKPANAALSEAIFHEDNEPTGCPTLGLGLALTNWITVQSSFNKTKRAADKNNRQQSWSQTNSRDLIRGRRNFHLNQIRWVTDKSQKKGNV